MAHRYAGIGMRQPHHVALLTPPQPAPLGFVEVHSENFFGEGGAALAVLDRARERWPVSLHGVGLSLGSACGLDEDHLALLAALVRRVDPIRVSDHASFARAPSPLSPARSAAVVHAADLLPLAFTPAALDILVANVQRVQERLQRPILVENLSAYLHWSDDEMSEPAFFNALVQRSGCGLLLDVNNLVVNALNDHAGDEAAALLQACDWVSAVTVGTVGEIHVAGHDTSAGIVIDDHGSAVPDVVWQVYRHALQHLGPLPTLVEWDTRLPPLPVLLGEAAKAEALARRHQPHADQRVESSA